MSNPNSDPKLSLKLVFNKQGSKFLFAEANSDFVNVLLSFLTLPLGKVITILQEHCGGESAGAIGSLSTLYASLLNLDDSFFCVGGAKQMLLNPSSSLRAECCNLMLGITGYPANKQYYVCPDLKCTKPGKWNVSLYSDIAKCDCGKWLSREIRVSESLDGGAFITNPSSFIITDDLTVEPMTEIVQMFKNHGTTCSQGAKMVGMSFGINEIKDLLMFCLTSATPLTDTILKKPGRSSTAANVKPEISIQHNQKDNAESRKMILRVCLQKSTNNFLFAVATDEFVELLFSFLIVPLGGVEFLLGGKAGLKNIDNLYRSISNGIHEYFSTPQTKTKLIDPKLPHGYISKNQFLPLSEEAPPALCWEFKENNQRKCYNYSFHENFEVVSSFKLNKELYMKKYTSYIVTDDITVSPSLGTSISILNDLGICLSDVNEMEMHVGMEEALRILKTSLTSKTVLTDALIKPMLKLERPPKQEL